jgi:hypothetical protein
MGGGTPVRILAAGLSQTIIRLDRGVLSAWRRQYEFQVDSVVALSTECPTNTGSLDHHRRYAGLPARSKECFIDPTVEN